MTTSVGGATPAISKTPEGTSTFEEVSSVEKKNEPEENPEMSSAERKK